MLSRSCFRNMRARSVWGGEFPRYCLRNQGGSLIGKWGLNPMMSSAGCLQGIKLCRHFNGHGRASSMFNQRVFPLDGTYWLGASWPQILNRHLIAFWLFKSRGSGGEVNSNEIIGCSGVMLAVDHSWGSLTVFWRALRSSGYAVFCLCTLRLILLHSYWIVRKRQEELSCRLEDERSWHRLGMTKVRSFENSTVDSLRSAVCPALVKPPTFGPCCYCSWNFLCASILIGLEGESSGIFPQPDDSCEHTHRQVVQKGKL